MGAGLDLNYGSDQPRAEEFGIWFNQGDFCGLPSPKRWKVGFFFVPCIFLGRVEKK